jgi:hypothetical protein
VVIQHEAFLMVPGQYGYLADGLAETGYVVVSMANFK